MGEIGGTRIWPTASWGPPSTWSEFRVYFGAHQSPSAHETSGLGKAPRPSVPREQTLYSLSRTKRATPVWHPMGYLTDGLDHWFKIHNRAAAECIICKHARDVTTSIQCKHNGETHQRAPVHLLGSGRWSFHLWLCICVLCDHFGSAWFLYINGS
jgi:hypothetical protein